MKLLEVQSVQTDSFVLTSTICPEPHTTYDTLNPDDFKVPTNADYNYIELQQNNEDFLFYTHKIYKCHYTGCIKVYKSKENMTLHYKNIHLKLKPYKCRFCDCTFSHRNGNFKTYLGRTYHERKLHTKYLPYKCIEISCGISFPSKSSLCAHTRSTHRKK
jgi:uncharacterized Zn-finger protein